MESMLRAGRYAFGLVAALALGAGVGCEPEPPGVEVDAGPTSDGGADAQPGDHAGLVFDWTARPSPSGDNLGPIRVTSIRLPLREVRAVGDAAPGDMRTSISELELEWRDGKSPRKLEFSMAPPGLYSRFEFRVQGSGGPSSSFELRGELDLPGHDEPIQLKIEGRQMLPISLPLSGVQLDVGEIETIEISVNLVLVLAAVDWTTLEIDDGKIEIDDGSPEIFAIRAALASAFSAKVTTAE